MSTTILLSFRSLFIHLLLNIIISFSALILYWTMYFFWWPLAWFWCCTRNIYRLLEHNCLMCIQWDCRCSNKRQSVQIVYLWYPCILWLFSDPLSRVSLTADMPHWVNLIRLIIMGVILFLVITISILFHNDNYDYCWNVYVHGYSVWVTELGFLKLWNVGSTIAHLPEPPFRILEWTCYHRVPLCHICILI